jgi:hypothetical protein
MRNPPDPGPKREDVAAVAWFLPLFERVGAEFGRWWKEPGGKVRLSYCPDALEFVRLLEERGWVEAGVRAGTTTVALRHWQEPALVAAADSGTLRLLLADIVRTERICEGHLLDAFERGYLVAILRRLKELDGGAG